MRSSAAVSIAVLLSACPQMQRPDAGLLSDGGFVVNNTLLAELQVSSGALSPPFSPNQTVYTVSPATGLSTVTITATPQETLALMQLDKVELAASKPSAPIEVTAALTRVELRVTNGDTETSYVIFFMPPASHYVKPNNTAAEQRFGQSVSISGDTLAVGAPGTDGGVGSVHTFLRTDLRWEQQAVLSASNAEAGDGFGAAVSLSGDSLAVGAPFEDSNATGPYSNQGDNSATNAGAVYLFERDQGVWSQQGYLKGSATAPEEQFGAHVALQQDTLAVGAPGEASGGAVYVFTRTGSTWSQHAVVKPNLPVANSNFGSALSLDADSLAIGAPFENSKAGAAYVFLRQSTSWAQQVRLLASNARSNASFGSSVALFRDALAVGSVGESSASRGLNGDQQDASAQGAGAVYLFTRSLGLWSADGYFKASNTTASAQFGSAVALSGTTLAVTARGESGAGRGINSSTAGSSSNSGAAYLFSKEPLGWRQVAYVKANAPDADDAFGQSVALSANTLVIGSPGEASSTRGVDTGSPDNAAPNAGAVLIFGK